MGVISFCLVLPRAKTIQERLNSVKKVANFEIAALFFSLQLGQLGQIVSDHVLIS